MAVEGLATESGIVARVVQISDCHLGPRADYRLAGVRTYSSFQEVLASIVEDTRPDLVMVSGDIAAHGYPEAYRYFSACMEASRLDYRWLAGNHDDFPLMLQCDALPPYEPETTLPGWKVLSLNTAQPGQVGGHLPDQELAFLDRALSVARDQHIAIFMHHPPLAVGCRWLDGQRVANGAALAEVLHGHDNVRGIFTGHVHQEGSFEFEGIPLYTTPSTCFQFAANSEDFALANLPPGFRRLALYDDGRIATDVEFLANSGEKVDTSVHGY